MSYACMHDLSIYDQSCKLIFCHLALMTFWNYRSAITSADCFDRYYRLSDFRTIVLTLKITEFCGNLVNLDDSAWHARFCTKVPILHMQNHRIPQVLHSTIYMTSDINSDNRIAN